MKVIFLEDVANVAKAGEVKEVTEGYGRNFLIPKKLAVQASPKDIKEVEAKLKARARKQAETEAQAKEMAKYLDGKAVTLEARAGQEGRLYGSVTSADIAEEIQKAFGSQVDKRKIELDEPIHSLGTYSIPLRLTKDATAKITVNVVAKKEE